MVDLINTCVLIRTKEENEMILNEAEKQGFHWRDYSNCQPMKTQRFPDILKFYPNNNVFYGTFINPNFTFYEVSELLGTKEMTAREFAEWIANTYSLCGNRKCSECVLRKNNTKCGACLCGIENWIGNIDEILEIVASGRTTVPTPEEKAIDTLENFIENPDRVVVNEVFVESLKLAVEKLKEEKCYL